MLSLQDWHERYSSESAYTEAYSVFALRQALAAAEDLPVLQLRGIRLRLIRLPLFRDRPRQVQPRHIPLERGGLLVWRHEAGCVPFWHLHLM